MAHPIYEGSVWKVLSPFASLKARMTQARRQAEALLAKEEAMMALPALSLDGLAEELDASRELGVGPAEYD